MKTFIEICDSEDEVGIDRLLEAGRLDYRDMGKVLATYRAWPGPFFWVPFGLLWLLVPLVVLTAPDHGEAVFRATMVAVLQLIWGGGLLLAYGMERHRVCEHGLVVGFRKRSRYVIPWSTIDPGRVRIGHNMGLLGRHPALPQTSPRYRVGVFSLHGLILNGLDAAITSPWNALDPSPVHTPFNWWLLATRRADRLAADIEKAMVADGYPAQGLAQRARAQTLRVHWKPAPANPLPPRRGFDPVLGVDGPLMK